MAIDFSPVDRLRVSHAQRGQVPTAQAAADANPEVKINDRRRVLKFFYNQRPKDFIDYELHLETGIALNSVNARRGELSKAGFLRDTGKTRPTNTGTAAEVWVISEKGIRLMESNGTPEKLPSAARRSGKALMKAYNAGLDEMESLLLAPGGEKTERFNFLEGYTKALAWVLGQK